MRRSQSEADDAASNLQSVQDIAMSIISEFSALYLNAGIGNGPLKAAKASGQGFEKECERPTIAVLAGRASGRGIKMAVEFPAIGIEFNAMFGALATRLAAVAGALATKLLPWVTTRIGGGTHASCCPTRTRMLPTLLPERELCTIPFSAELATKVAGAVKLPCPHLLLNERT